MMEHEDVSFSQHAPFEYATDPMTGLPGQPAFMAAIAESLVKVEQASQPVSLVLADIDRFEAMNQRLGRDVGDETLRRVARAVSHVAADAGQVFRYGGDAFIILLEGMEKEDAFLLGERVRNGIENGGVEDNEVQSVECPLRITAGVAAYPDDGGTVQEVIRKVNEALYRGKVRGGNTVCIAREEKMVTKTSHYTQGQLLGLTRLAKREGLGEAELLREALDDLLRKYNA